MQLIPLSRERMSKLKEEHDEDVRVLKISETVTHIYKRATAFAYKNLEKVFKFKMHPYPHTALIYDCKVPSRVPGIIPSPFTIVVKDVLENMDAILINLRILFPGCSVEYNQETIVTDPSGSEYNISKLGERFLKNINIKESRIEDSIVISWVYWQNSQMAKFLNFYAF